MVSYRLMEERDTEAFLCWRRGNPYLHTLVLLSVGEQVAEPRQTVLALGGEELIGTAALVRTHLDPDMADGLRNAYVEAVEVKEGFRRWRSPWYRTRSPGAPFRPTRPLPAYGDGGLSERNRSHLLRPHSVPGVQAVGVNLAGDTLPWGVS